MTLEIVFFYFFAAMAVSAAIFMLTRRTALSGAVSLIVCLLAFSGLYVMLDAPFVAVMQAIIYAGAIMMLVIFVIMTMHAEAEAIRTERGTLIGALVAGIVVVLGIVLYQLALPGSIPQTLNSSVVGTIEAVGLNLFTRHVLNFEMISLLLLVALVGALILAKHNRPQE